MVALRVILLSMLVAGLFACLGTWWQVSVFGGLNTRIDHFFYFFCATGAIVGAIAGVGQSIVDYMRQPRRGKTESTES
jgi:hypothetical protein